MYYQRSLTVVLSVSLCLLTAASYAALPINSVQDGAIIQGGTYGNTADNVTTFQNSTGGGLWLQSGQTLRGVEVDAAGNLTHNGGSVHLYAPGQVVRVDGNIDVRGVQGGNGAFLGDGGRVFVDSAYLFQQGNIFASGVNGGLVQLDVGSMTMSPTAKIMALGYGGQGGLVSINASGAVDLQRGSVIETTGQVSGAIDTNVINIEGGLVNVEGTLQANGVESRGGTIRLVSTGQTDLNQAQGALTDAQNKGALTASEANTINTRLNFLKGAYEGSIRIASGTPTERQAIINAQAMPGTVALVGNDSADATPRAGDGGTILITAQNRILNGGWLLADGAKGLPDSSGHATNGGNGGTINLNAGADLITSGRMTANGGQGGAKGGDGGLLAFNFRDGMSSTGTILALGGQGSQSGGNGGLIDFAGNNSPLGNGMVVTAGGQGQTGGLLGNIVVINPLATQGQRMVGNLKKLSGDEAVNHAENLIILSSNNFSQYVDENGHSFAMYLGYAQMRTVRNPNDDVAKATAVGDYYVVRNQAAISEMNAKLKPASNDPNPYYFRNFIFANSFNRLLEGRSDNLASADVLKQLNTVTILHENSRIDQNSWDSPFGNGAAGGHFSLIGKNVEVFGVTLNPGNISGGSINIALSGSVDLGLASTLSGRLHGGSVSTKASQADIFVQNEASGGLMGGTVQMLGAFYPSTLRANGALTGGSIYLNDNLKLGSYGPNPVFTLQAKGGLYGGNVQTKFGAVDPENLDVDVSGSVQNGKANIITHQ